MINKNSKQSKRRLSSKKPSAAQLAFQKQRERWLKYKRAAIAASIVSILAGYAYDKYKERKSIQLMNDALALSK